MNQIQEHLQELMRRLEQAQSDEEKNWLMTEAVLRTHPPEIAEAAMAAAVPHWFTADVLAALLQLDAAAAERRYQAVLKLPFTEKYSDIGYALHDLTRAAILWRLSTAEPERFQAYNQRAAEYFARSDEPQYQVESIYHQLAVNEDDGMEAWLDQMKIYCNTTFNVNAANMLLFYAQELMKRGQLTGTDAQWNLAVGYERFGDMQMVRGSVAGALDAYQKEHEIYKRLVEDDPSNNTKQRDLSVSYNKLGDVLVQQGNSAAALDQYQQSRAIRQRLAAADPANTEAQRDLSVSYNKLGDVLLQQGNSAAALDQYQQSLAIRQRLAAADPANTQAQRDLSVSYNKLGDVLRQQGNSAAALDQYQQSLAIAQRLAAADHANTEAQRDVATSYNKLGRAEEQLNHLEAALDYQQHAITLVQELAKNDTTNKVLQIDCVELQGVIYRLQGDQEFQRNELPTALSFYKQALTLSEQVYEYDPSIPEAYRDCYLNHLKIGIVHAQAGRLDDARQAYQQALAIAEPLAERDPLNQQAQEDLAAVRAALKELEG